MIGLAYRSVLFLKLDGEMGDVPLNGGVSGYASLLKLVIRELQEVEDFNDPSFITGELLDNFIEKQRAKGHRARTIHGKLRRLEEWLQYNHTLPFFFRLNETLFEDSSLYQQLLVDAQKELSDYQMGMGGSRALYPLQHLKLILTEAIDYIENYAEDCLLAARLYKDTKERFSDRSHSMVVSSITEFFRSKEYRFTEPLLEMMQDHALSLKNTEWESNPKIRGIGPVNSLTFTVKKIQAACTIVTLMLTAMRRGEFDTLQRYPKVTKSSHHELDGSLVLERIVHKTAKTDSGEPLQMPVPTIVVKAVGILSQISEINDGKKDGVLNLSDLSFSLENNGLMRIRKLIVDFCEELGIDAPTPHQLRHAMAFIVSYLNDAEGMELAMMMLGHKSTEMTKKYLGHFKHIVMESFEEMFETNKFLQQALIEFQEEQSAAGLEKIITEITNEQALVGPVVKRFTQFSGSMTDEAKAFFIKTHRLLLERGMLAIVQHPTHLCVRDLTDSSQMSCQLGFNREDFAGAPVMPSQCDAKCGCRLYTQQNVEALKEQAKEMKEAYPEDIRQRLSQNTYFTSSSISDTYSSVISEYEEAISKKEA